MKRNQTDTLTKLTAVARRDYGNAVFWSLPVATDQVDEARNVGRALSKHGGMKGLQLAANIERALLAAGLKSWR